MRYYITQSNNTSIDSAASRLYDNAMRVSDKARVLGGRIYKALQSEITKLYEAKENVGVGIESILQKIGSLYQQKRQKKMQVGVVVSTPHGNRVIPTEVPYEDQRDRSDEYEVPGLVHAKKGSGMINVNPDQFKKKKKKRARNPKGKKRRNH